MAHFTDAHIALLVSWFNQFLWPFLRVGGLLLAAPVLGDNRIPARIKMGICVALTVAILPTVQLGNVVNVVPLTPIWMLLIVNQILIGIGMGFILRLVFNAIVVGGESIATTMGLGYALMNDPANGIQIPIVSQFYTIFVTLLYLSFDGHHAMISLISESFVLLPVGVMLTGTMLFQIVEWSSVLFAGALQVALPALAALLTVNLVMGVMTRSAPQLNLFSVGFPITMMVGFLVITLTLPTVAATFQSLIALGFDQIREFLEVR